MNVVIKVDPLVTKLEVAKRLLSETGSFISC